MAKEHDDDLLFDAMCKAMTMQARRISRYERVLHLIADSTTDNPAALANAARDILRQESREIPQPKIPDV